MRARYFWLPVVIVVSFLAGTLVPTASTQTEKQKAKWLAVGYMKVEPGKEDEYIKFEQSLWKPLHQELIKSGKMRSWEVYAVQFPSGTEEKYDFVTFDGYDRLSDLDVPLSDFQPAFAKVHPGMKWEEFLDRTFKARKGVHTELWTLVDHAE